MRCSKRTPSAASLTSLRLSANGFTRLPPALPPSLTHAYLDANPFNATVAELSDLMEPLILDYIVDLVQATRDPVALGLGVKLAHWIEFGASPRARTSRGKESYIVTRSRVAGGLELC